MTSAKATDCALPRFSHKWQGPNNGQSSRLQIAPSCPPQCNRSMPLATVHDFRGAEAQKPNDAEALRLRGPELQKLRCSEVGAVRGRQAHMQNNCRRVLCQQRVGHRHKRPEAQRLGGTPTQAPEAQKQSGGQIAPKTKGRCPSHKGDAHGSNTRSGNVRRNPPSLIRLGRIFS